MPCRGGPDRFARDATSEESELLDLLAGESGARARPPSDSDYRAVYRVAVRAGQLAGFACVQLADDSHRPVCDALLDIVFVFEQWRGEGVGRGLFDDLCDVARENGAARLRVISHPWAEAFFRQVGARRVGAQPPCALVNWYRPVLDVRLDCRHDLSSPELLTAQR